MSYLVLLGLVSCVCSESIFYESFTGNVLTNEEVKEHIRRNTTFWCVNEILPCDPREGRRVDGSCNNLKYPTRGAPHTPTYRLLPAEYDKGFEPRKSKSGKPLPLSRSVRTGVLAEGRIPSLRFTQLLTHFWLYIIGDFVSVHDTVSASPIFDLSLFYGNSMQILNEKARLFENGLLKTEIENGKIWPPSMDPKENLCILNQLPHETRCHDTPDGGANRILGVNLFVIWTWRLHNRIATVLSALNPCWNDDKVFFTTRDLVIAISIQIYSYELMPALMGNDNLLKEGIIGPYKEFRDLYDENVLPQISLEFLFVLRWAHTLQEGKLKMYDANGYYLKEHQIVNITLRTGYLVDNLDYITQGAFRQPAAEYDYIVDPDLAETALGGSQQASDVLTSDLSKNRYFGFPPYIRYRKLCSGKTYNTFEDLLDVIDPERIELLKEKYKHLEDIDLLTGIWLERPIKDGYVPVTMYCILIEQMLRTIVSDRHWYERPNRSKAFTLEQLLEVRKASVAQFLCAVGDTVTEIQPHAFFLPGKGNEIRSCREIQKINLYPWKDQSCDIKQANILNAYV